MTSKNNPLPVMLHYFRKKKNLTQEEIAKMLSISRASYANYETGRIIPHYDQIVKLSKILEHDFLFAYTISCEAQLNENSAYAEYVYEGSNYNASNSIKELPSTGQSLLDKELINVYSILRKKGEDNE